MSSPNDEPRSFSPEEPESDPRFREVVDMWFGIFDAYRELGEPMTKEAMSAEAIGIKKRAKDKFGSILATDEWIKIAYRVAADMLVEAVIATPEDMNE